MCSAEEGWGPRYEIGPGPARPPWSRQVCVSRVGSPVAVEWPAAGAAGGKCPPQAENFWAFSFSISKEKTSFSIGNHEFLHPCFAFCNGDSSRPGVFLGVVLFSHYWAW